MLGGKVRLVWTPVVILISAFAILAGFQNCTPAVPFGNTDYYRSLVNSPEFPYEVKVDQVAYMSCSEQEDIANDGTFFTFRVGAFDSGGLRISQSYRDNITNVRNSEVPAALTEAQTSSQARLQLAIRTLDNFQLMYIDQDNGEDGINGSDYNNFFPSMGDENLNNILWYMDPNDYLRTFAPAKFPEDYRFEGELQFMKSQIMENDLRTFFGGRGLITLTWAMPGEIKPLGPGSFLDLQDLQQQGQSGNVVLPDPGTQDTGSASVGSASSDVQAASNDLATDVFGVGVQPRFKQPLFMGGSPGSDMPPRVLSSVNDVVIDSRMNGNIQRPWSCPDSMQFMIVLPKDAIYDDGSGNMITRCSMDPDPVNPSTELQIIRQSLYAEDFYVDLARKCIVPKPDHTTQGSCYGKDSNTQLTHIINYDTFASDGCGFGNAKGLCPHYASVCFRQ